MTDYVGANEKVWGESSVEVEWKSGTPFMTTMIYTSRAGIRASKGASKKLQMTGYGWYGKEGGRRERRLRGRRTYGCFWNGEEETLWVGSEAAKISFAR